MTAVVHLRGPEIGDLRMRLGNGPSKLVGGGATVNEAARPEQSSLSDFAGNPLKRVDLPVYFDGFDGEIDVSRPHTINGEEFCGVEEVLALSQGGPKGQFPAPFLVLGDGHGEAPIPFPHLTWLLELPDWGDGQRGMAGQKLIRQELILHLIESNNPQDDVPIPHQPSKNRMGLGNNLTVTRVITVKHTETLLEVAVEYFGDSTRAHEIGKLNGIRDIRTLIPVGEKLRLPVTS